MANEEITFKVLPRSIEVVDGHIEKSKLWYQAPGLDIYVSGHVCRCREHTIHYMAVENAVARHIPAIAMRHVREVGRKKLTIESKQKRMF